MAAHGVRAGEVVDAGRVGRSQLQEGGGEVGDVDGAADVVGEQDAVARAGGEFVHDPLVHGPPVPDDQGCPGDRGLRVHGEDAGLGGGLGRAVGGDGVGEARLVVVDV